MTLNAVSTGENIHSPWEGDTRNTVAVVVVIVCVCVCGESMKQVCPRKENDDWVIATECLQLFSTALLIVPIKLFYHFITSIKRTHTQAHFFSRTMSVSQKLNETLNGIMIISSCKCSSWLHWVWPLASVQSQNFCKVVGTWSGGCLTFLLRQARMRDWGIQRELVQLLFHHSYLIFQPSLRWWVWGQQSYFPRLTELI